MNYSWSFWQIAPYIPYFLGGAWVSFQIAFIAIGLGCAVGGAGAAIQIHGGPLPRALVRGYVSFFTNTPQLVVMMTIFFVLPEAGFLISPFWAAAIGLTLAEAAYLTDIIKAGVQSINRGQVDAAETLGLSRRQTLWYITIPHSVKVLYPTLCNQFILCVLYTSIAAVIGNEEITGRALTVNGITYRSFEIFTIVGAIYVGLTIVATLALYLAGRWLFRVRAKIF